MKQFKTFPKPNVSKLFFFYKMSVYVNAQRQRLVIDILRQNNKKIEIYREIAHAIMLNYYFYFTKSK